MPEVLLEMKKICKQFDGNPVLKDVDFSINAGEVHALVGENGAGKSTLMNILAGLYPMDSGEITLYGKRVEIENAKNAQKLGIGSIFQNYSLFYDMSIAENIYINQEPTFELAFFRFIRWRSIYKGTREILTKLNIHADPRTPVRVLGIGEQKFIELARTIVNKSRIIIMDEPTASLNEKEVEFLFKIIADLKGKGISIIYISHRMNEIRNIADRITVLRDGGTISTIEKDEFDTNRLIKLMIGDEIKDRYPKLDIKIGKDVLIVKNLSDGNKLKGITFSLRKGEILGITGLKGSGKTTLAKVLFGAEASRSGSVYLRGKKMKVGSTEDTTRNGLCYVPPNRMEEGLVYEASVADNIVLTDLYNTVGRFGVSRDLKKAKAEQYVKMLGIKLQRIEEKVKRLSGGNQKKVILAKWLFRNSRILILNEPTSSVDIASKVDIYNILNELVMSGASIIMVTSEIPELLGMCDRILVMHQGRIAREFTRGEATQEKILYYASGGK